MIILLMQKFGFLYLFNKHALKMTLTVAHV